MHSLGKGSTTHKLDSKPDTKPGNILMLGDQNAFNLIKANREQALARVMETREVVTIDADAFGLSK